MLIDDLSTSNREGTIKSSPQKKNYQKFQNQVSFTTLHIIAINFLSLNRAIYLFEHVVPFTVFFPLHFFFFFFQFSHALTRQIFARTNKKTQQQRFRRLRTN